MGGGGSKGWGDWAMIASNPVQAAVPELFGIKDWDPVSSGFSYLTGMIAGEDTSGYKPQYAGGPGYTPPATRDIETNQQAWADYYKTMAQMTADKVRAQYSQRDKEKATPLTPVNGTVPKSLLKTDEDSDSLLQ